MLFPIGVVLQKLDAVESKVLVFVPLDALIVGKSGMLGAARYTRGELTVRWKFLKKGFK